MFLNDDQFVGPLQLPITVPFFDREWNQAFVSNNGVLSFGAGVSDFVPQRFPLVSGTKMIAALWTDIDTRGAVPYVAGRDATTPNRLFYRVDTSNTTASRVAQDVAQRFPQDPPFLPVVTLVVTWYKVGAFSSQTALLNTFQIVFASDGVRSYSFIIYEALQWGTPTSGSGFAQAGFDAADGYTFTILPGSFEASVTQLVQRSNVGAPGFFAFRVDTAILSAGCGVNTAGSVTPRQGSMLGGTQLEVRGPCVASNATLLCRFGDAFSFAPGNTSSGNASTGTLWEGADLAAVVPALYIDNSTVQCTAPYSRRTGTVPVYLSRDAGASWSIVSTYNYLAPQTRGLPVLHMTPLAPSGAPDGGPLLWPAPADMAAVEDFSSLPFGSDSTSRGVDLSLSWALADSELRLISSESLAYSIELWEIVDPLGTAGSWLRLAGPDYAVSRPPTSNLTNVSALPPLVTPAVQSQLADVAIRAHSSLLRRRTVAGDVPEHVRLIGSRSTGALGFSLTWPDPGSSGETVDSVRGYWAGRVFLDTSIQPELAVRPVFVRFTARAGSTSVFTRVSNLRWMLPERPAAGSEAALRSTLAGASGSSTPSPSPSALASPAGTGRWDAHSACAAWRALQVPPARWNARLPQCPQTVGQVTLSWWRPLDECNLPITSALVVNGTSNVSAVDGWGTSQCWANRGRARFGEASAARCYESTSANWAGATGTCCYDGAGRLLRAGAGAGSDFRFAQSPVLVSHWWQDALPRLVCCALSPVSADCDGTVRPDGGFSWRGAGGAVTDPHFLSLDGAAMTYNGAGDVVYLGVKASRGTRTPTRAEIVAAASDATGATLPPGTSFISFVRLVPMSLLQSGGSPDATAIRGWAGAALNGARVAVTVRGGDLHVRVNGTAIQLQPPALGSGLASVLQARLNSSAAALTSEALRHPLALAALLRRLRVVNPAGSAALDAAARARAAAAAAAAAGEQGSSQTFGDVTVEYLPEQRAARITWTSVGVSVTVGLTRVANSTLDGVLMQVSADVAPSCFDSTYGLLGNFDGNPANDLLTYANGPQGAASGRLRALQSTASSQRTVFSTVQSSFAVPLASLLPDLMPSPLPLAPGTFPDETLPLVDASTLAALRLACALNASWNPVATGAFASLSFAQAACFSDGAFTRSPDLGAAASMAVSELISAQAAAVAPAPVFSMASPATLTLMEGSIATLQLQAALPAGAVNSAAIISYATVFSPGGACFVHTSSGLLTCGPFSLASGTLASINASAAASSVTVAAMDASSGASSLHFVALTVVAPSSSATASTTASGSATGSPTPSGSVTGSRTPSGSVTGSQTSTATTTGTSTVSPLPTASNTGSGTPVPTVTSSVTGSVTPSGTRNATVLLAAVVQPADSRNSVGEAAGGAVGGIIGSCLLIAGLLVWHRKHQKAERERREAEAAASKKLGATGQSARFMSINPTFRPSGHKLTSSPTLSRTLSVAKFSRATSLRGGPMADGSSPARGARAQFAPQAATSTRQMDLLGSPPSPSHGFDPTASAKSQRYLTAIASARRLEPQSLGKSTRGLQL